MTGFGEADGPTSAGTLRVEIRTVNHRYLNVNTRLPAALSRWDTEIREWLRESFTRGAVNLLVRWETSDGVAGEPGYRLDEEKLATYLRIFRDLGVRFGIQGTPDLSLITRFNDVIVRSDADEEAAEVDAGDLKRIVIAASRQVVEMREEEGRRLDADLRGRLAAMEDALTKIQFLAPERLVNERNRLRAAVVELLDSRTVDEQRVAQEIALLAERWDVSEELVRFRSHNELFADFLDSGSSEPVGKRLSFLVQEMHREANTIGSKANNAEISHLVVAIKDELERLREQVENVE
jgi:uncharacterized protein (TIGR00255 family)